MSNDVYVLARDAGDPETHSAQLWVAIVDLAVVWVNAVRIGDADGIHSAEDEFRFFSLAYVSLRSDGRAVTTGRKAIIRSLYAQYGGPDTANVKTILHAVITREQTGHVSA